MSYYTLQFNRIAERLVFSSLKQHLINKIGFSGTKIFLQSPSDQYVNTRTEATDGNQENRYPAISIYTIMGEEDKAFNSYDMQSIATSDTQHTFFESDMMFNATVELCLETTTAKDYMDYKNRLLNFISDSRHGLPILNDLLPNQAYFMIISKDMKDFVENDIRSTVFTFKLQYRIYKEYLAYIFKTFDLLLDVDFRMGYIEGSDPPISFDPNNGNIIDVSNTGYSKKTVLHCLNYLPANTPVFVNASSYYFEFNGMIPDLRTSALLFNTDLRVEVERDGMPLDKGSGNQGSIVTWFSSTQLMFDAQINIGETIVIFS